MPAFTEALRPALKSERLLTTTVEDHGPGPRPTRPVPWRALALVETKASPSQRGCCRPRLPTVLRAAGRREAGWGDAGNGKAAGEGSGRGPPLRSRRLGTELASKPFPLISIPSALKSADVYSCQLHTPGLGTQRWTRAARALEKLQV